MNDTLNFADINTFIFDVDGVLTSGTILLLENGLQARQMNIKDGYALQLAITKGYRIIVISGGSSDPVIGRLAKLGVVEVHLGVADKKALVQEYMTKFRLRPADILYMGDDMPDIAAMMLAGLPACPADAVPEVKGISRYISSYAGGQGCVRDVIEKVLKLNEHWHHVDRIASN